MNMNRRKGSYSDNTVLRQANEIERLRAENTRLKEELAKYEATHDEMAPYVDQMKEIHKAMRMYKEEYENALHELETMKRVLEQVLFNDKYKKIKKKISG